MYDLTKHPFFTKWTDPESGIESFILTKRIAPVQYPFYFTNPSVTHDGERLWFYVAFPPSPHRYLATVSLNPDKPEIKWFPQGYFSSVTPMIAPDDSGVYFMSETRVCFIDSEGQVRIVGEVPASYINNRHFYYGATHLSISADGKWFFLDGEVGNLNYFAIMDVKSGEFKLLHEFPYRHDHAMFSPVNPKQVLVPRDWRRDRVTGQYIWMEQRLYVTDIDQTYYRNLRPDVWEGHGSDTAHEWWSRDGLVCYVDYDKGIYECNPDTLETTHVWKRPICHGHCNSNRTLYCADQTPYLWNERPVEILFYNRTTDKETHIVSRMPKPPMPRDPYHLDPHPHFSPDDNMIIYMTTVLGEIDVAITPTAQF